MRIAPRSYSDRDQLAEIEQRLAGSPDDVGLLFERACCLEDLGWGEPALRAYRSVLLHDARHLGALTNLGLLMAGEGESDAARALFARALAAHPRAPIAHVNAAKLCFAGGESEAAIAHHAAALALDPDFFAAHHGLAAVYEAAGDAARAAAHLERAFARRATWTRPYTGGGDPLRVLLLVSARGGDVVTHPFLDERRVETTVAVVEGLRERAALPPHDLIFNAIGDADRAGPALVRASELLAHASTSVINAPQRVLATGRANAAAHYGDLANVRVPRTERLARARITATELRAAGWTFPLLIRAPGFHTGNHFERVETAVELAAGLAGLPGPELLVIAFVDVRGPNGAFAKYRVLCIDGRIYPAHLAMSATWKVHYFSADMADRADYREAEARFLRDMHAALGPRAFAAIASIAQRLDLDYGGIDFGIDPAGNVVLFEANATMAVYPPAPESRWAYRFEPYRTVVGAVTTMIGTRARDPRAAASATGRE